MPTAQKHKIKSFEMSKNAKKHLKKTDFLDGNWETLKQAKDPNKCPCYVRRCSGTGPTERVSKYQDSRIVKQAKGGRKTERHQGKSRPRGKEVIRTEENRQQPCYELIEVNPE
jgi:hypothetical protein